MDIASITRTPPGQVRNDSLAQSTNKSDKIKDLTQIVSNELIDEDMDISIEVGRNNDEQNDGEDVSNNDNTLKEAENVTIEETKLNLNQINVNNKFNQSLNKREKPTQDNETENVNYTNSDTVITEPAIKKLKLDRVPTLGQSPSNLENAMMGNNSKSQHEKGDNTEDIVIENNPVPSPFVTENTPNDDDKNLDVEDSFKVNEAIEESIEKNVEATINESINEVIQTDDERPIDFENSAKLTPIAHQVLSDFDQDGDTTNNKGSEDIEYVNTVGKRNDELNIQNFELNQRLNHLLNDYDTLKIELKQFNVKVNLLQDENVSLKETIDNENKEVETIKKENMNYQKEVKDIQNELSVLQSNQTLLKEKYDTLYVENSNYQNTEKVIKDEVAILQKSLEESANMLEELHENENQLKSKINEMEMTNQRLTTEKNELSKESKRLLNEFEIKDNEISDLEKKIKELIETDKDRSKNLIDQVAYLTNDKLSLEEQLRKIQNTFKTERLTLDENIAEKEKNIREMETKLKALDNEKSSLQKELKLKDNEIHNLNENFHNVNDDATVRTAEVHELKNEVDKLKENKLHLEGNVTNLEEQLQGWKLKYDEQINKQQELNIEIETLQDKIAQDQNSEMPSTSNEHNLMAQLKGENEQLKRQIEDLRKVAGSKIDGVTDTVIQEKPNGNEKSDVVGSKLIEENEKTIRLLQRQISGCKQKLEQRENDTTKRLKKLSEDLYVQYSSKHEQKVKLLRQNYENKYKSQIEQVNKTNESLILEIEQLNKQLQLERKEKQEVLKLLESKE